MESTLATSHDADLILKLYDLRREATMRRARHWITAEFFPQTAEEAMAPMLAWGTEQNAWFRQVTSYWEMALSFVVHGALNGDLFLDCNGEPFFIYAKFQPFLAHIRTTHPNFLMKMDHVIEQYPAARQRVDMMLRNLEKRRAAAKA
ncbi:MULTISPECIES: hypothetical protein [Acidobacterium]|uniref:Uncharacterized protein n=1 Tax=Acidobacterium capsulatum (strain ATCC 51196 / DSM 11244 / BCRC 80197 / JCM 7670 / NBRC 15755 / NCIMB 13165 / 161) TaxID=240015 RepID=C1F6V3_ACIC5|nr:MULTISPECIES: hypothetical protein [Acidobacterium]ACO34368.1 hypothetical protein ACP_3422 [Acidobacterium capsulatum ATCC 51196]HCT60779.1 hypothetical protein [Acidobacterium sp.]